MRKIILAIVAFFLSVAQATGQEFSASTGFNTRIHFVDSGVFTTKGAGSISSVSYSRDWLTLEGVAITPLQTGPGEEYDAAATLKLPYDVSVRLAGYHYNIGNNNWRDDLDLRVSYDGPVLGSSRLTLTPKVSYGHKWSLSEMGQTDYIIGVVSGKVELTDKVVLDLSPGVRFTWLHDSNKLIDTKFVTGGISVNITEATTCRAGFALSSGGPGNELAESGNLSCSTKF